MDECRTSPQPRADAGAAVPARFRGGVLVWGFFDGFHRGHQAMMARARAYAGRQALPLVVATFDSHARVGDPRSIEPFEITSAIQRADLFRRFGADEVVIVDGTGVTSDDHVRRRVDDIVAMTGPRHVMMSSLFTFGPPWRRDAALAAAMLGERGVTSEIVEPFELAGDTVSAERIRRAIRAGDCATTRLLMSRPFCVVGIVRHGNKIGRTIGFPTANVQLGAYVRPRYGVYAVRGRLPGGRVIDGVANLGVRPMIEPPEELLEPHFLDFTGDLYGERISVELVSYLRPEVRLSGLEELADWIRRDCEAARAILERTPHFA